MSRLETIIDLIDETGVRVSEVKNIQMRYAKTVVASQWIRTNGLHSWRRSMEEGRGGREGGRDEGDDGRCWWRLALKRAALDRCTRPVALINGGHQLLITRLARNCNPQRNRTLAAPLLYNGLRRYTSCVDNSQPYAVPCCLADPSVNRLTIPSVIMLREEWGAACFFHHSKIVIGEGFNRIFLLRWWMNDCFEIRKKNFYIIRMNFLKLWSVCFD